MGRVLLLVTLVMSGRPAGVKDSAPRKSRKAADDARERSRAAATSGGASITRCFSGAATSSRADPSATGPAAAAPEPAGATEASPSTAAQAPAAAGPQTEQQHSTADDARNEQDDADVSASSAPQQAGAGAE